MHKTDSPFKPAAGDGFSETESHLAHALALISKTLTRLDEPGRAADIQSLIQRAGVCLEAARQAHQATLAPKPQPAPAVSAPEKRLESETIAVIAAAIAAALERPYRVVSARLVTAPVPHLNVWALEGRTQIAQSHKIR